MSTGNDINTLRAAMMLRFEIVESIAIGCANGSRSATEYVDERRRLSLAVDVLLEKASIAGAISERKRLAKQLVDVYYDYHGNPCDIGLAILEGAQQ